MPSPPSESSIIRATIDSAFNAILLEAFFCGLYTLLFGYTLRLLLRKKNKKAYASALTLLWVLVMLTFSFDWQIHRNAFVVHNDSPIDIADVVVAITRVESISILNNVCSWCTVWLADAMLIWRCYILWEDKRWVLLPLPVLFLADIVFGLLTIISSITSDVNIVKNSAIFFVSFFAASIVITFMGTSLLIVRILLVTGTSPLTNDISAYRNIQRIVLESGIIYSIAMFITGVALSIELTGQTSILTGDLVTYMEALLVPFAGIGPTLIAVRVGGDKPTQTDAGGSRTRSRSSVLSHLTFRRTVLQNDTFDIGADGGSSPY